MLAGDFSALCVLLFVQSLVFIGCIARETLERAVEIGGIVKSHLLGYLKYIPVRFQQQLFCLIDPKL